MQRKARALALLGVGLLGGCVATSYVPSVREDYAAALSVEGYVYVHVLAPTVRAVSLKPPSSWPMSKPPCRFAAA